MTPWSKEENPVLWLLTPEEFSQIPNETVMDCIDGTTVIKGKDYIDNDTRGGHLAFGIRGIENHPLRNLLQTFLLKL